MLLKNPPLPRSMVSSLLPLLQRKWQPSKRSLSHPMLRMAPLFCTKHSDVLHKAFGEGAVTKIDKAQKHIRVTFGIGEKTFIFPDAFKQGFLKMKGE